MTEYVHLVGAEEVRSAGHTIRRAAGELASTAGSLDSTRDMFMRQLGDANQVFFAQLDERLDRFEALVKRIEEALQPRAAPTCQKQGPMWCALAPGHAGACLPF